jgi:hypothetical protein
MKINTSVITPTLTPGPQENPYFHLGSFSLHHHQYQFLPFIP